MPNVKLSRALSIGWSDWLCGIFIMQFTPDIEECIRKPLRVRKLIEPRKSQVIAFLHQFRRVWHQFRAASGEYPDSEKWLKRRNYH